MTLVMGPPGHINANINSIHINVSITKSLTRLSSHIINIIKCSGYDGRLPADHPNRTGDDCDQRGDHVGDNDCDDDHNYDVW